MCILGNILVIISVFTYRPLQNVQNIFIVSLAVADLLVCVLCVPFHIVTEIVNGKWIFGPIMCQFFLTLDILLCTASILHLCCIALDRYWAIKDSIKYAQKRTLKRVIIMILAVWILSAFISVPGILWNDNGQSIIGFVNVTLNMTQASASNSSTDIISTELVPQPIYICDISKDISFRFYSSFGTFYIPLIMMSFVYLRIFLETKKRLRERAKAAKKLAKSIAKSSYTSNVPHKKSNTFCPCFNRAKEFENQKNFNKSKNCGDEAAVPLNSNDKNINNAQSLKSASSSNNRGGDEVAANSSDENVSKRGLKKTEVNGSDIDLNNRKLLKCSSNPVTKRIRFKKAVSLVSSLSSTFGARKSLPVNDNVVVIPANSNNDENENIESAESDNTKASNINGLKSNSLFIKNEITTNEMSTTAYNASTGITTTTAVIKKTLNRTSIDMTEKKNWTHNSANTNHTLQQRQKISLTRERRAARTLGIIMGAFTICWAPFFLVYVLQSFGFEFSDKLVTALTWLGYVNSALNPLIYTIFNLDFRKSFKRILFNCSLCKK